MRLSMPRMALAATCLLLASCVANQMYRPVSLEETPDYSLAFIELDDQGELWDPAQLERALGHLQSLNRQAREIGLVVFVHGWNDSASVAEEREDQGVVFRYRQILARLAADHEQRFPGHDMEVFGIFLSWRGEVSTLPLLRQLSFYNRRGAAERIAGATATEAIYRVLMTARENPRTRSVLIGHSFGSMILERALAQAVVSALLAAPGEELIFPADLVVLFNPAGSAIQTKQLVDILARNRLKTYRVDESGQRFERPLLLSFTSEADRATRMYFPLGMGLKATNKKFRQYGPEYCSAISNQRWLYAHTAGHTPALHSHEMTVSGEAGVQRPGASDDETLPPIVDTEYDPISQQVTFSFHGEAHRFTIRRKPRAVNDTPYWIMQVPRELIPSHSDVFSADTFALVEAALAFSGALEEDIRTTVVREQGVRPVAIVPRIGGGAFFLDRSRGVYSLAAGATQPVFLTCMREPLDPDDAIGFHVAGNLAYAAISETESGSTERCHTELYEFEIEAGGYRRLDRIELAGNRCFSAAAIDLPGRRLFLTASDESGSRLFVANLTEDGPRPGALLDVPGMEPATSLYFEASQSRLFMTQGGSGALWELDLGGDVPELRRVADGLGWLAAMGFDKLSRRLFVTDVQGRRIWAFDCHDWCTEPTVFLQSETLENPITLEVAPDGRLWLGDLREQTLMTIAPDGSVETVVDSLPGGPP